MRIILFVLTLFLGKFAAASTSSVSSVDYRYFAVKKYCAETRSCRFDNDSEWSVNGFGALIFYNSEGYQKWRNQENLQIFSQAHQFSTIKLSRPVQSLSSPALPISNSLERGRFVEGGYEYQFDNFSLNFKLQGSRGGGVASGGSFGEVLDKIESDLFNPGGALTEKLDNFNRDFRATKSSFDKNRHELEKLNSENNKLLEAESIKALDAKIEKTSRNIDDVKKQIDQSNSNFQENMRQSDQILEKVKGSFDQIAEKEKLQDFNIESGRISGPVEAELQTNLSHETASLLEEEGILPSRQPYQINFQSQGEPRVQLEQIYQELNKTRPRSIQGKEAKAMGYIAVEESDKSYAEGDHDNGQAYKEYAQKFLDIAASFTHFGIAKDLYEGASGKNMIDGQVISTFDRGILLTSAAVGVGISMASAGFFGGTAEVATKSALKGISRIGERIIAKGMGVGGSVFGEAIQIGEGIIHSAANLFDKTGLSNFIDILKSETGAWAPFGGDISKAIEKIKYSNIWSEGKFKDSVKNAYRHYKDHRKEFPEINNALEYVEKTHEFIKNPPTDTLIKTRINGEKVFYHPNTETFAVQGVDGAPKTMFKPDPEIHNYPSNLEYFNAQ